MHYLAEMMKPYLPLLVKNKIPKKFIIDAIYIYKTLYEQQKNKNILESKDVFLFAVKLAILHYEETRAVDTAIKQNFQKIIYENIDHFLLNNQIKIENHSIRKLTSDNDIFTDATAICTQNKKISCSKSEKHITEIILNELDTRFSKDKKVKSINELIEKIKFPYNPFYLLYFKACQINTLNLKPEEKDKGAIVDICQYINSKNGLNDNQLYAIMKAYLANDDLAQTSVYRIVSEMAKRQNTIFSNTKNNKIKYYSNAYENKFKSEGAFKDILEAIQRAKSHIMITGWAIDLHETLGGNTPLGELLVIAAKRKVSIHIMPWQQSIFLKKGHEAHGFYNDVVNMPAYLESLMKQLNFTDADRRRINIKIISCTDPFDSNHQKMVIVDEILFAGGLDLTYGRTDTSKHFMRDKQNWHDCHSQIEGPLATEAMRLFMGMWRAQPIKNLLYSTAGDSHAKKLLWRAYIATEKEYLKTKYESQATVKLCCSITGPAYNHLFETLNKDVVSSIQKAYINAIESAENFIYMENQFFIGDYFNKYGKLHHSVNQIPKKIAEKIIERHKTSKDFIFACVLPFRPEGDPHDFSVQTILRKQWKTMEWLISHVNYHTNNQAQKYIRFINIGHTVVKNDIPQYQDIYVHSKLLIVDDKKLIIGSANCNERSQKGNSDTEIALYVIADQDKQEMENIREYRTRLIHEHLGKDFSQELINEFNSEETLVEIDRRIGINLFQLEKNSLHFNLDDIPFEYLLIKPMKAELANKNNLDISKLHVSFVQLAEEIIKNIEKNNLEKWWQLHALCVKNEYLNETKLGHQLFSIYENFCKLLSSVSLFASIFRIAYRWLKLNPKDITESMKIISEKNILTEAELYNFLLEQQKIDSGNDLDGKKININEMFLKDIKEHLDTHKLKDIITHTKKYGFATSWGNIPLEQLYQSPAIKPPHVPNKTPIKGIVFDKVVNHIANKSMFK